MNPKPQEDAASHSSEQGAEALNRLNSNLEKVENLSKRLVAALSQQEPVDSGLNGPGHDLYLKAGMALWTEMLTRPNKLLEKQAHYWGEVIAQFAAMQAEMATGKVPLFKDPELEGDRRFANPLWNTHPYFNYVRHQYVLGAEAIRRAVDDLEGMSSKDRARVDFFANQVIDLFSPTNFFATNPDALERAVETDGESLVTGLENLVRDIEAHGGNLLPTLADPGAFEVGKNLATTPGKVVFRNRIIELIQYEPTTEQVHKTPLIIFPPWINKFYILDLKAQNSLIKWIVDQGYTLFVVSWKNPDAEYAELGFEDYIEEGYLTAIEQAKQASGETQLNAIGYCIAGTTLTLALAVLKKRGDKSIKSATYFTTLTDFSEQGEFTPFLQDDFVDAIERHVAQEGLLESKFMSRTFSFLRSKDLIYAPAVRSYMMGEAPPAFDLLYWNGDSTNMPGRMAVQYLRQLCQQNQLSEGSFELMGETLSLNDITIPVCAIACETDHIAAWKDSFRGVAKMASKNKTFILSESGHIAGIVNPPTKRKYGHYTNADLSVSSEDWLQGATYNEGSWWPRWQDWLSAKSGKMVDARKPGSTGVKLLGDAPGIYVLNG